MAKKRLRLSLEMQTEASNALDDLHGRTGMYKRVIVSRVLEWVARQDQDIIAIIMGAIGPRSQEGLYRALARRARELSKAEE